MPPSRPEAAPGDWALRQRRAFDRRRGTLPGAGVPWLDELREGAIRQFEEDGPPGPGVEEWRTAPVGFLSREPFLPRRKRGESRIGGAVDGCFPRAIIEGGGWIPEIPTVGPSHPIAFADGLHCPDLVEAEAGGVPPYSPIAPNPEPLPPGVSLRSLSSVLAEDPDAVRGLIGDPSAFSERRLSRRTDRRPQSLVALNAALAADGAVLRIEPGVRLERPVEIVHASSEGHWSLACTMGTKDMDPVELERRARRLGSRAHHLRTIISLGEGASADVIETRVGGWRDARPTLWTNVVSDIALGEGASLRHVRLDECADAVLVDVAHARLARGASLTAFVLAGRAGFCRTETRAVLEGEGARVRVNGLCLAGGECHIDALTRLDHEAPGCSSAQTWRGVFRDDARGGFQGRIRVLPGADGTDARMECRNLLLGPGARAESKPELEILADDVACSHASATGALAEDELFYLRSRGVPRDKAEEILVRAFAGAALEGIPVGNGEGDPVADLVRRRIRAVARGDEDEWEEEGEEEEEEWGAGGAGR